MNGEVNNQGCSEPKSISEKVKGSYKPPEKPNSEEAEEGRRGSYL